MTQIQSYVNMESNTNFITDSLDVKQNEYFDYCVNEIIDLFHDNFGYSDLQNITNKNISQIIYDMKILLEKKLKFISISVYTHTIQKLCMNLDEYYIYKIQKLVDHINNIFYDNYKICNNFYQLLKNEDSDDELDEYNEQIFETRKNDINQQTTMENNDNLTLYRITFEDLILVMFKYNF